MQAELKNFKASKEFFIGIDSDGCVFDTMEIKQKECFCPNYIKYFELQSVSKYAREIWEFVNLYSKTRGVNRFLALIEAFDLLSQRKEVADRNLKLKNYDPLRNWTKTETRLGNPALKTYLDQHEDDFLSLCYEWSVSVNQDIKSMVYGITPFPYVLDCLNKLNPLADAMVVSQTPVEALSREWKENKIDSFVEIICGQEYGTKTEHLKYGAVGKYAPEKILMIGDAPGDLKAAKANGVLFYPINPGHEEASWERLYQESLDRFFNSQFAGAYQDKIIDEFNGYLPEKPNW